MDSQKERAELVILAAFNGHQLRVRNPADPRKICGIFCPDYGCACLFRDGRHVHRVIQMCVGDQDVVGAFNVGINDCFSLLTKSPRVKVGRESSSSIASLGVVCFRREMYGSMRSTVLPSEISHPAVPRYESVIPLSARTSAPVPTRISAQGQ